MYQKSVFDINYDYLSKLGIKYLIFDLDNTLGVIDDEVCSNKVKDLINKLSKEFTIIVASNNNFKRVSTFCMELNVQIMTMSLKPTRRVYRRMKKYTQNMQEVAIIGDQIMTDILLGNRFHMLTILVDPLAQKDLKITGLNRYLEKKIMKKIDFKRGVYYEKK